MEKIASPAEVIARQARPYLLHWIDNNPEMNPASSLNILCKKKTT
jgi:hypothetical protein